MTLLAMTGAPQGPPEGAEFSGCASRLLRWSALKSLPPIEPLIDGVVSLRGTVVTVGSTGVLKTFTALSMAFCVATGTPWLGRSVRRVPVLYVLGEGAYGMPARAAALEAHYGVRVRDDDVAFRIKPRSLVDDATWSELLVDAREIGARFVVLDTLSSLASDADETKDAARIMRRLSDLAVAIDGTVMLVHHAGWSDDGRTRGGSQFEADADEVLLLRRVVGDRVVLKRKKVKDGPAGAEISLTRRDVAGSCVVIAAGDGFSTPDLPVHLERAALLVGVLVDNFADGPGATRDEARRLFCGLPEVARLKPDTRRVAYHRAFLDLVKLRRIVRVGTSERFRFLQFAELADLDRFGGELPPGLSIWDPEVNAWTDGPAPGVTGAVTKIKKGA